MIYIYVIDFSIEKLCLIDSVNYKKRGNVMANLK